jgi:hypothetical protein
MILKLVEGYGQVYEKIDKRSAFALPPQHGHLMSRGDEFKLQRSAAAKTEGEQRSEGGKKSGHANGRIAGMQKSPVFLDPPEF